MREILGNRYEIQQQLGKKAGRRTLLARDLTTGDLVIIKLLTFGSDFEWDDLKLFEREAETLKSLSHPSIPRYLDYFEVNSPTYQGFALIQTHIPASTLEQYLQSGRTFTEIEVKQIALSILEILIYLHGLYPPVIHRDIKPSNILLGERSGNSAGQIYLVDFGSVQTVLATEGSTRTVVGTYGYMPQEQFGGRTVPASDLYSLGATLIYLTTGTHPADLPQKDFCIQFQQLTNLTPSFTNWLKRMTEPSLEKRFSSATEALTALEQPEYVDITTLTIGKPAGSKIQLTKNEDALEIIIPPFGFQKSMVLVSLFTAFWNSFILVLTLSPPSFPSNIPFALFSLPFWIVGFTMICGILYCLFGSARIRIDYTKIVLYNLLGKWQIPRPRSAARETINKLVYTPKYFTIGAEGDRIPVQATLVIWAGAEKFELVANNFIIKSEAELEWLAHELSDWLNIEITS